MGLELADLFREYGADYRKKYADKLLPSHRQAMWAIEYCRTERLGGQVYGCPNCQEFQYSYHSCRNRHCPKCQHELTQNWLKVQQKLLLPVPYFFLTFTLPSELRDLVRANQKTLYSLLFQASAEAAQNLALDPRFIGGQIGLIGVLHTWTRNLIFHPHVHYLAPAGGLHSDGKTWLPARPGFFLPVRALSRLFRAAFRRTLHKTKLFDKVPSRVWTQDWIVHCKAVGDGQAALKYLAPYIHRVAISNRRLLSITAVPWKVPRLSFTTVLQILDNSRSVRFLLNAFSSVSSSMSCRMLLSRSVITVSLAHPFDPSWLSCRSGLALRRMHQPNSRLPLLKNLLM